MKLVTSRLFSILAFAVIAFSSVSSLEAIGDSVSYKVVKYSGISLELPKQWKKVDSEKIGPMKAAIYGVETESMMEGVLLGSVAAKTDQQRDKIYDAIDLLLVELDEFSWMISYDVEVMETDSKIYIVLFMASNNVYDDLEDVIDHGFSTLEIK